MGTTNIVYRTCFMRFKEYRAIRYQGKENNYEINDHTWKPDFWYLSYIEKQS